MENINIKAVLTIEDELYYIYFPGIDMNEVYGESLDDAIEVAQESLGMYIVDLENNGEEFVTEDVNVKLEEGQSIIYINIWMPYQRSRVETVYKKKTLTIPTWLDILATQKKINFSSVLVGALKKELGLN
ncbi:MAG: type II toxin-antitoxin system HicB family antitoxin [Miniphocaeibacter sp.]|uniref:type II toxin-antitoxin system HicB family antitoxin n=1 Tax=Miniphocaeibacter sp. TaxID=3100973 RepID=UPI001803632D|nr:hypothetical protein [Gallicola sp.]